MGIPGGPSTQAAGRARNFILNLDVVALTSTTIRITAVIHPRYRNRYLAVFVAGRYHSNIWVDSAEVFRATIKVPFGTTLASVQLEDAGRWAALSTAGIAALSLHAEINDAESAQRLCFKWTAPYTITIPRGDTQLTSITVTGAKRNVNVGTTTRPTRGKLHYQILEVEDSPGTYIVRWWSGTRLVAQGTRTGNGALTCTEINGSGLEVTCTLTYTADVKPGTAFIDVKWPLAYQVHYSPDALSYPRTPEGLRADNGQDDYEFLTAELPPGTYNWNILTIDDGNVVQSSSFPSTTPKVINYIPLPVEEVTFTGNAAALELHWLPGEEGCTYDIYSSLINEAINFGDYTNPAIESSSDVLYPYLGARFFGARFFHARFLRSELQKVMPAIEDYPGIFRFVIRATKDGIQEKTDKHYHVEFDEEGNIVYPRPNRASLQNITVTSALTLTVEGVLLTEEQVADAIAFDLFVVPEADEIDLTDPQASVTLDDAVVSVQRKEVSFTVPSAGWYKVAILARAANGSLSRTYYQYLFEVTDDVPEAVEVFEAKVIGAK